jgi:potassium channel LctB
MHRLLRPIGLHTLERMSRQSYSELLSVWFAINFMFAMYYFLLTMLFPAHGISLNPEWPTFYKLLDSLYFSIITATTTGYGDIVPLGFSKLIAAIQMVLAFGTFAIFLGKLIAANQELAEKPKKRKR